MCLPLLMPEKILGLFHLRDRFVNFYSTVYQMFNHATSTWTWWIVYEGKSLWKYLDWSFCLINAPHNSIKIIGLWNLWDKPFLKKIHLLKIQCCGSESCSLRSTLFGRIRIRFIKPWNGSSMDPGSTYVKPSKIIRISLSDPDPIFDKTDPRIRIWIRIKMKRIHNTDPNIFLGGR